MECAAAHPSGEKDGRRPVHLLALQLGRLFPDWGGHILRASQLMSSRAGLALRSFECQFEALSAPLASSFSVEKLLCRW